MEDMFYSDQDFAAWLASMPGKTQAQKLNYLQDVLGMTGVDLFGAKQEPFVPAIAPVNQIEAVWGNDPGMAAIMDFIQVDKMSPKAAVDKARELGEIPQYNAAVKGEVDYLDLASQFAAEEAKRPQFEAQQAADLAAYEAGRKPGLNDMFATPYEQMGAPSVDDLMAAYAGDRQRYMASSLPKSDTKMVSMYGERVPRVSANRPDMDANMDTGVDASKMRTMSPEQRQKYLAETKTNAMSNKSAVVAAPPVAVGGKGKAERDVQQAKRREQLDVLSRRNFENRIKSNSQRRVATPQGEQIMQNLALLGLLNG